MLLMFWGEGFRANGKDFNSNHKQEKLSISDGMSNILKNLLNYQILPSDKKFNGLLNAVGLN
ncbi:MAG: hypothetical protein ACUZ8N_08975 [Candidatus Scalindua sp.]